MDGDADDPTEQNRRILPMFFEDLPTLTTSVTLYG
jgi:hypothetical protein